MMLRIDYKVNGGDKQARTYSIEEVQQIQILLRNGNNNAIAALLSKKHYVENIAALLLVSVHEVDL